MASSEQSSESGREQPGQRERARDMQTDCERSMRYHQERLRFYESCHRWVLFSIFLLSLAAVLRLFDSFQIETHIWLPAIAAVLAGISLVFDLAGKARRHESLYQRFTPLAAQIAADSKPDDDKLADWERCLYRLYADEPPVYRALNALCHNQMAYTLGSEKEQFLVMKWHHRLFRNFWPFQGTNFPHQQ